MSGFFVDRVRILLLVAIGFGALFVYYGWMDSERIRHIKANGVEATATIMGSTRSKHRNSESYTLKLGWVDGNRAVHTQDGVRIGTIGAMRTHNRVPISKEFAGQIMVNDKVVRSSVRIKYLPGADADSRLMLIVLDDPWQQRGPGASFWLGAVSTGVGVVGFALMFLFRRLRHSAAKA
jgi:hypothetical protein